MADGPTVSHPPSSAVMALPPSAGGCCEPLRPAWPSRIPTFATTYVLQKSTTRFSDASYSSLHRLAQRVEIQPSIVPLVISTIKRPTATIVRLHRRSEEHTYEPN